MDLDALQKTWENNPDDLDLLAALAFAYCEAGQKAEAINILQSAIQNKEPTPILLKTISSISLQIDMPDFAARFLELVIKLEPENPDNYSYLSSCYMRLQKYDAALEIVKTAVAQFPAHSQLWNDLGVITRQYLNDYDNAVIFYKEALRLDPDNVQALNNLAECYGSSIDSILLYYDILAIEPDNHDVRLNLATALLQNGRLRSGWAQYESRLKITNGVSKNVTFEQPATIWDGENLQGKTILLMAEQGIGDEILFASIIPRVILDARHVIISCDARLISVYKRSFPKATVITYEDSIEYGERIRQFPQLTKKAASTLDYAIPIGSLPKHYWPTIDHIKLYHNAYLTPPKRQASDFRAKLNTTQNPLIFGLSWRSDKLTANRMHGYWDFNFVKKIVSQPNVTFVNLQYNATDQELDELKEIAGENFIVLDDINLFENIDANLAIMANMDLVIGPAISTQMMAMAIGKFTWVLAESVPWWMFGTVHSKTLKHQPQKNIFDAPFSDALKFTYFRKTDRAAWEKHTFEMFDQWVNYFNKEKK